MLSRKSFSIAKSLVAKTSVTQNAAFFSRHASSAFKSEKDVTEADLWISKSEVSRFMHSCMTTVGTPSPNAALLADNLLMADERGHFSHGLNRLAMYVQDIKSGMCSPTATPELLKETSATAWVDGKNALGVVVGKYCMDLAIEKAKGPAGIGWVSAKGSGHFGVCQWYTERALTAGMVGMAATNTSPLVAPTRGQQQVFGTNPISIAAPSARSPDRFLLDMSTSAVAVGKIEIQMRKGEKLPSEGWSLGEDGTPTTDANEAFYKGKGLMPLGGSEMNSGFKGYGLAMAVELLCGLMSGATYAHKVRKWTDHSVPADLGQMFIAVNPECFAPGMGERLQDVMDHLRGLTPADPALPVLVPGDPELLAVAEVARLGGIRYTPNHIVCYQQLSEELGVEPMKKMEITPKV